MTSVGSFFEQPSNALLYLYATRSTPPVQRWKPGLQAAGQRGARVLECAYPFLPGLRVSDAYTVGLFGRVLGLPRGDDLGRDAASALASGRGQLDFLWRGAGAAVARAKRKSVSGDSRRGGARKIAPPGRGATSRRCSASLCSASTALGDAERSRSILPLHFP